MRKDLSKWIHNRFGCVEWPGSSWLWTVTNPWHAALAEGTPSQCSWRATSTGRAASTGVWRCTESANWKSCLQNECNAKVYQKVIPPSKTEGTKDFRRLKVIMIWKEGNAILQFRLVKVIFRVEERKRQQEEVLVDQVDMGKKSEKHLFATVASSFLLTIKVVFQMPWSKWFHCWHLLTRFSTSFWVGCQDGCNMILCMAGAETLLGAAGAPVSTVNYNNYNGRCVANLQIFPRFLCTDWT